MAETATRNLPKGDDTPQNVPSEAPEGTPEEIHAEEGASDILGSVNEEGSVVREGGSVLGKATDEAPQGSVVDTEGNILDHEGNIIGKADLDDEALQGVEGAEVPEGVEAPEAPELKGPFEVKEDGQVANTTGVDIGKLVDTKPEDLEGREIKDIDSQGNLKAESGSVLGRVELNEGVVKPGEQAEDAAGKAGEEVEGATGEAKEAAEGAAEEAPALDFSILEGLKLNKLGKVVNEKVSCTPPQNPLTSPPLTP